MFSIDPEIKFTPKKAWDAKKMKGAWIIANVAQLIMADLMEDAIRRGVGPSGQSFGAYKTPASTARGYRLPPDFPNPPPGHRATVRSGPQKGWLVYDSRADVEKLAGRDASSKRYILSGAMWQSLTIAIKSEAKARLYFKGSSGSKTSGKVQNRVKAKMAAGDHGADILAASEKSLRSAQKFIAVAVSSHLFQDAIAKAERRKPRRQKAQAESRLRSSISLLRTMSLINHASNSIQGGGGAAALKLPM